MTKNNVQNKGKSKVAKTGPLITPKTVKAKDSGLTAKTVSNSLSETQRGVGSRIGYCRISTSSVSDDSGDNVKNRSKGQKLDRQLDMLEAAGCVKIFRDELSGSGKVHRPGFEELKQYLRAGDTVVVSSFSRLSRSLKQLLETVEYFKDNGIHFISLSEQVDTTTPTGELILGIFGSLNQYEREIIRERVISGIAAAKRRGVKFGRARALTTHQTKTLRELHKAGNLSIAELAEHFSIGKSTVFKYLAMGEENNNKL